MRVSRENAIFFAVLVSTVISACQEERASASEVAAPVEAPHGHDHDGEETSDLDRPLTELLSARCEHDMATVDCAECRYEIGAVRLTDEQLSSGLIKTARPTPGTSRLPLGLTGEVTFDESRITHLSPLVEGRITRVYVKLGDTVQANDPIAELESTAIGEAQSARREAQAALMLSKKTRERVEKLRSEGIASERERLEAEQAEAASRIRYESAIGTLKGLGGEGNGRLLLKAPSAGTILSLHAVPGEVSRDDEPLAILGDPGRLWVLADVYESDLAAVLTARDERGGLDAEVSVKAWPGQVFAGRVSRIPPVMDDTSRTVRLRVEVENPEGKLMAGMFATVQVFVRGSADALLLPREAVQIDEGRSFVFVHHQGNDYFRRPVEVSPAGAGVMAVKGISAEQEVVTRGAFLLKSDVLRSKMGAGCAD